MWQNDSNDENAINNESSKNCVIAVGFERRVKYGFLYIRWMIILFFFFFLIYSSFEFIQETKSSRGCVLISGFKFFVSSLDASFIN